MFANGLGDQGSILGWVIPKTKKIVLDVALISAQHYKVRMKSSGVILHLGVVAIEKGAFRPPSIQVANLELVSWNQRPKI